MSRAVPAPVLPRTIADLLRRLGNVPADRVRLRPLPGTATEKDVLDIAAREKRLCELVDGVLVEKPMGFYESRLAVVLVYYLEGFLEKYDLGIVLGADGTLRLMPQLVRIPDVSFIPWKQLPNQELPAEPIPDLVPELAVEILSASNTEQEMNRKLREYFKAGVRLVWLVDPAARTVRVHASPRRFIVRKESDTLDGGKVLPGFCLPVRQLFARAGRRRR